MHDPAAFADRQPTGTAATYPGWVAAAARLLLRVFFGRIEVAGVAGAAAGALLYVANHNNGLIDPMLVLAFMPGRPRLLGKNTLWRNPLLRPFLALGRVIPVFRPQDSGFDPARNEESFSRCREVLAAGGAIALFPEGKSHASPGLAALRTGAARIVLGLAPATREALALVPVGLLYDAPGTFRSRVLVRVGAPLPMQVSRDADGVEPSEAVRRLTAAIAAGLDEVTVSYRSWDEAHLLERAADLWLQPDPDLANPPSLAARFAARRRLLARYRELAAARPQRLAPLRAALAAYDRLLGSFGIEDAQVGASYPLPSMARFLLRSLGLLLVRLPLAIVGTLLGYVPYRLCGWAGALAARDPDQPATFKLFAGIVFFPAFWIAEAILAGRRYGALAAAAIVVAGPLGGWAAIRFRDRLGWLRSEVRAYLMLRGGRLGGELRRRRAEVRRELLALAAEVGEPLPDAGTG